MKQILKKLLKKTITGTTETIVNERIEKELLTQDELEELTDQFGGDYESAYETYGLMFDYSEELSMIDLDRLACGLEDFLKDEEEYESLKEIANKIEPWRTYNLDFESEPSTALGPSNVGARFARAEHPQPSAEDASNPVGLKVMPSKDGKLASPVGLSTPKEEGKP